VFEHPHDTQVCICYTGFARDDKAKLMFVHNIKLASNSMSHVSALERTVNNVETSRYLYVFVHYRQCFSFIDALNIEMITVMVIRILIVIKIVISNMPYQDRINIHQ